MGMGMGCIGGATTFTFEKRISCNTVTSDLFQHANRY